MEQFFKPSMDTPSLARRTARVCALERFWWLWKSKSQLATGSLATGEPVASCGERRTAMVPPVESRVELQASPHMVVELSNRLFRSSAPVAL